MSLSALAKSFRGGRAPPKLGHPPPAQTVPWILGSPENPALARARATFPPRSLPWELQKSCSRCSQGHFSASRPAKPPQEAPGGRQEAPKSSPRAPKRPPRAPRCRQEIPRGRQEAAKMPQDAPKRRPRGPKSLPRRSKRPQEPPKKHLRSTKSTQKGFPDQAFYQIS